MTLGLARKLLNQIIIPLAVSSLLFGSQIKAEENFVTPAAPAPVFKRNVSLSEDAQNIFEPPNIERIFLKGKIQSGYSDPISLDTEFNKPFEITIDEVFKQALLENLDLKMAELDSKIAKWQFWEKFSDNLPDFSFGLGGRSIDGTFFLNSGIQAPVDEDLASRNIRFDYRVFNGGTTLFLTIAEKFFKNATEETERDTYNRTIYESSRLYNSLASAQFLVSSRNKALDSAKKNLDLSQKFLDSGVGTKLAVLEAEAQVARFENEVIQAEADFRLAEIELANHIMFPLTSILKVTNDNLAIYNIIPEDLKVNEFIQTSLENNPLIKRNIALKKAAINQGLSRVGDFLPKLDVYLDNTGNGPDQGNLSTIDTVGFNMTLEVGENLAVGNISNLMKSRNEIKKAKLALVQEERRVEEELRRAFIQYQQAKSSIKASEKRMLASKEALRLAKLRYENGLEIFANLVQRESDFFNSQSEYITNISNYNISQSQMAYLMGNISVEDIITSLPN